MACLGEKFTAESVITGGEKVKFRKQAGQLFFQQGGKAGTRVTDYGTLFSVWAAIGFLRGKACKMDGEIGQFVLCKRGVQDIV